MDLTLLRPLNLASGFVSAASGMVRIGDLIHVVADDALHLASFRLDAPDRPGELFRLLPGRLPPDPKQRKARKPDFESLTALPASDDHTHGALLALGSGSRPNRCMAALIGLGGNGLPEAVNRLDLSPIYAPLANRFAEVNIEGAAVLNGELLLFQRGNAADPVSAMIRYPLAAVLNGAQNLAPIIHTLDLPRANGVPLSITDATLCGDGLVFCAVAEDAPNAYDDGPLVGAAIGMLSTAGELLRIEMLEPTVKVEGITAGLSARSRAIDLLLVTDADDPAVPAALYSGQVTL